MEAAVCCWHDLPMKYVFLSLGAAFLLSSCAAVHVVDVQTAAVVTQMPKAIYLRPFSVEGAVFIGLHEGGVGERPLRQSLAPAEFTEDLKEELEKLAPARILQPDEVASQGWLVEGSLDEVDAGHHELGRSHIKIHVRVIDLDHGATLVDSKNSSSLHRHGRIIYEFDLAGGSHKSIFYGSVYAPGTGYATPFDYRNAAERIRTAIEPDPLRYGKRMSPTLGR